MARIELLSEEHASKETQELYGAIKSQMGKVPNVYRVYGHSSAALKSNLMLDECLSQGQLSTKEIEIIALTVSQFNHCDYCLAAHTFVGKMSGLSEEETLDIRKGTFESEKEQSLIDFTNAILKHKGKIGESDIEAFLAVGYGNGHIVEVIGQVAKNIFNNYTNHIAETPVDFPQPQDLAVTN